MVDTENLQWKQRHDPHIEPVLRAREANVKPSADSIKALSVQSHKLFQLWDQLTIVDGLLFRQYVRPDSNKVLPQLVVPTSMRESVLQDVHEGAIGGHLGEDKTLACVKEIYYWPGHYTDVRDWCKTCLNCAARKSSPQKPRAPLQHVTAGSPMQVVVADIVGPFPESLAGNSYVLVVGDYFTRWVEAYPIANQEAVTVARKLTDEFFFRFSLPEQLHSDQGRQFESEVVAEVCKLLGIRKTHTTPYHPQSDGFIEGFNRTLLSVLAALATDHPFEWESHLRPVCMAYNTSVHPTTGYIPFYLMFGRQVRMPIEVMYGYGTQPDSSMPEYARSPKAVTRGL